MPIPPPTPAQEMDQAALDRQLGSQTRVPLWNTPEQKENQVALDPLLIKAVTRLYVRTERNPVDCFLDNVNVQELCPEWKEIRLLEDLLRAASGGDLLILCCHARDDGLQIATDTLLKGENDEEWNAVCAVLRTYKYVYLSGCNTCKPPCFQALRDAIKPTSLVGTNVDTRNIVGVNVVGNLVMQCTSKETASTWDFGDPATSWSLFSKLNPHCMTQVAQSDIQAAVQRTATTLVNAVHQATKDYNAHSTVFLDKYDELIGEDITFTKPPKGFKDTAEFYDKVGVLSDFLLKCPSDAEVFQYCPTPVVQACVAFQV
eukprot:TRINITY_DN66213_c4_g4_i2.p1 TRINITY_DN66213_c4_g4~~TRINITY_DN66213_c4_g4_i2.p1  ORF type:complete len:316 (+),score=39.82 TRINITY_DN66213_c4_g4_i2:196-1143(+)